MKTKMKSVLKYLVLMFGVVALVACATLQNAEPAKTNTIKRHIWVKRHNPQLTAVDLNGPLTVGNGGFAYTADVTGMQTFVDEYFEGIPLETMSDWGWNTTPNTAGHTLEAASRPYDTHGRTIMYPTNTNHPAGQYFRTNPHRIPLGQIGMEITRADGSKVGLDEIEAIDQTLDMYAGVITSKFAVDGVAVEVRTACHPGQDTVGFTISSPLLAEGRIKPFIRFPYNHSLNDSRHKLKAPMIFGEDDKHETTTTNQGGGRLTLQRKLDTAEYYVNLAWTGGRVSNEGEHKFVFDAGGEPLMELTANFTQSHMERPERSAAMVLTASAAHWPKFWERGGAIDFSRVDDPRAKEIEKRVVLSTYLMAVQMAGDKPDQESGLTHNSWHGKHHTEMYWWHAAHFALWGRPDLIESTMQWYKDTLPVAKALAKYRGLTGARWAKMVGHDGIESPGGNPFIAWNQPHVVELAELVYRARPERETLEKWSELVFETAEGMASYAHWEADKQRYVLGPPLWIAQEIYDQQRSQNPAYELEQWVYGLEVAQQWRERLGMPRDEKWQHVIDHMSALPVKDGRYVAMESIPDSFDPEAPSSREDHPTMLAPLGLLPGWRVDRAIMQNTLDTVMAMWGFERKIWGWDFPMIAMTAARLGDRELAVDVLLMENPSNIWRVNGHVDQMNDLSTYLPANGSYLSAIAMMAAGWDGNEVKNPGFPLDWDVRWEGINPLP